MATIKVSKEHTMGLDAAKAKAQQVLDRWHQKLSRLIKDVSWDEAGTRGKATGKMFSAEFFVEETTVSITVELSGLGAKFLAPKIESDLKRTFEKHF
jgi:Putative polyhydroxyalkanoic acid system protein (PHA_gran_rgn)